MSPANFRGQKTDDDGAKARKSSFHGLPLERDDGVTTRERSRSERDGYLRYTPSMKSFSPTTGVSNVVDLLAHGRRQKR